jgi:hypothetical protein
MAASYPPTSGDATEEVGCQHPVADADVWLQEVQVL